MKKYFVSYYCDDYLVYRCSIGDLSDEEADIFYDKSGIEDNPEFELKCENEISLNTEEEISDHNVALEYFREDYYTYMLGKPVSGLPCYESSTSDYHGGNAMFDMMTLLDFAEDVKEKVRTSPFADLPQSVERKSKKTRRPRTKIVDLELAVDLHLIDGLTQREAEEKAGVPQGSLSKVKGAENTGKTIGRGSRHASA